MITSIRNNFHLADIAKRQPHGIGISPYPLASLIRYVTNSLFNGFFSYINPDRNDMNLLASAGRLVQSSEGRKPYVFKIVFLGDIMISKSGNPPSLDTHLRSLLESADLIIANVESPVVDSQKSTQRGCSLNFEMNSQFLASIYACNRKAKWVFSIANNHACDTSRSNEQDVSGVEATIRNIRAVIPEAGIIGADITGAKCVLSLKVRNGPKIGIIGWTDVMNHDAEHYKKKVIRGSDLTDSKVQEVKTRHDYLIGFAHGNEEQSYYPLKETRDRWSKLIGQGKFDIIVGHGPHVLHPAELINNGLLFHSIGNFCSPVGKSQTKVGCIPEIQLRYTPKQLRSVKYKVHLIQQIDEGVSLIPDIHATPQVYPGIIARLKSIWNTL